MRVDGRFVGPTVGFWRPPCRDNLYRLHHVRGGRSDQCWAGALRLCHKADTIISRTTMVKGRVSPSNPSTLEIGLCQPNSATTITRSPHFGNISMIGRPGKYPNTPKILCTFIALDISFSSLLLSMAAAAQFCASTLISPWSSTVETGSNPNVWGLKGRTPGLDSSQSSGYISRATVYSRWTSWSC